MPVPLTGNISQALKTTLNSAASLGALVVDNTGRDYLNHIPPTPTVLTPIIGNPPINVPPPLNNFQWFLASSSGFQITFTDVTNAVNYFNFKHNTTSQPPTISAVGTDTNIDINLTPKGTGKVSIASGGLSVNGALLLNGVAVDVNGFVSNPLVDGGGY